MQLADPSKTLPELHYLGFAATIPVVPACHFIFPLPTHYIPDTPLRRPASSLHMHGNAYDPRAPLHALALPASVVTHAKITRRA